MPDGPEWQAVGDWTTPEGIGGTVCEPCKHDVIEYAIAHVLNKNRTP